MILCRFFSLTVGNCEQTEATEGLDRRTREPEESLLLSFVDNVEVLADDECLLSVAEGGDRLLVASWADGSQAGSCLNGWSMLIYKICKCTLYVYMYYLYNVAIIMVPRTALRYVCDAMQCNADRWVV